MFDFEAFEEVAHHALTLVQAMHAEDSVSPFVVWLDQTLGPPWSGLVVLAMVGSLSGFAAYMAIRTLHHVYRDKP